MKSTIVLFLIELMNILSIAQRQTYFMLSGERCYFKPKQGADWLDDLTASSFRDCAFRCHENSFCRTFDYNFNPNRCRLFQVEPSNDQIVCDPSSAARSGTIDLNPQFYLSFNKTCDQCKNYRYLFCQNGFCRCPFNAYWDGAVCQKQKYFGESCSQNDECRKYPYNLTCNSITLCFPPYQSRQLCSLNKHIIVTNITNGIGGVSYRLFSSMFIAETTAVMVEFSMMNSNAFWSLDDVSMWNLNLTQEVIRNGDFENGTLNSWNYCNPNNVQNGSRIFTALFSNPRSGYYYYGGAPYPLQDYLSQAVPTIIGHQYNFSFWVREIGSSSTNMFSATIFW